MALLNGHFSVASHEMTHTHKHTHSSRSIVFFMITLWFTKSKALVKSMKGSATKVLHFCKLQLTKSKRLKRQTVVDEDFMFPNC